MIRKFADSLQATAGVLAGFAEHTSAGTLRWDGTAYTPAPPTPFDPYAAKWWGVLTALAGLLEGQDAPLSAQQKQYLERLLFGGMGSFNDFILDEVRLGPGAKQANQELAALRKVLFEQFRRL
jgi:hypothetical protein